MCGRFGSVERVMVWFEEGVRRKGASFNGEDALQGNLRKIHAERQN